MKWIPVALLLFVVTAPAMGQDKQIEIPKTSTLLREREELRRENARLKHDLAVRDSYIRLEAEKLQRVLDAVTKTDDYTGRCAEIEAYLRKAEDVDKEQTFDCATLQFSNKKKS